MAYDYPTLSDFTIPNCVLAQSRFQGASGLPEDQYVFTTFWRDDAGAGPEQMATLVQQAIDTLFTTDDDQAATNLAYYMNASAVGPMVTVYDLSVLPPRVPYEAASTGVSLDSSFDMIPNEVAVVCSYHNGGPGPRNKGRFYIGPLNVNAVTPDEARGDARVDQFLRQALRNGAAEMMTNPPAGITWMQVSRANQQMFPVAGGWVDDAFDTIRSRGHAPVSRTGWGAMPTSGVGGPPGGKGSEYGINPAG